MPEFLLELYVSRERAASVQHWAESARAAADELSRAGTPVRFVRAIFVPDDETCFYVFEAASAEVVRLAAERASLAADRVAAIVG